MSIRVNNTSGTAPSAQKRPGHGIIRVVVIIFLVLLLLGGAVIGGIGVYFSNAIMEVIHYLPTYTLAVTEVSAKSVTLQRTYDTQARGEFEIDWPGGQAIVGQIMSSTASTVTRQLLQTIGRPLSRGTLTFWTRRVYSG